MSIQLICGDGKEVRLPRRCFEKMSLFSDPAVAKARSYTLKCRARSHVVNLLLDWIDGEEGTITEDNVDELRSLCSELGFTGLDGQLHAFRGSSEISPDLKELFQLREYVKRQDKRLTELQHQVQELLSWKRTMESVLRQFNSFERKVDDVARVCEDRFIEFSQKTERALNELAKRSDLEKLTRDVKQLKAREATTGASPTRKKPAESGSTHRKQAPPSPPEEMAPRASVSAARRMKISVRNLLGRVIPVEVEPTDRVEDLKAKIYAKGWAPPDQQNLFFEGRWLEEGNTLQYYSIEEGSTVDLMPLLYG